MISPDNFTEISLECTKTVAIYFPDMCFRMFPGVFNIVGTPFDNVSTLHVLVFGLKIGLVADSGMLVSFAVETTVRCPAITEDTGSRRHVSFYYGYWCGSIPIINWIKNNTVSFSGNNAKNPHLDTYIVISSVVLAPAPKQTFIDFHITLEHHIWHDCMYVFFGNFSVKIGPINRSSTIANTRIFSTFIQYHVLQKHLRNPKQSCNLRCDFSKKKEERGLMFRDFCQRSNAMLHRQSVYLWFLNGSLHHKSHISYCRLKYDGPLIVNIVDRSRSRNEVPDRCPV